MITAEKRLDYTPENINQMLLAGKTRMDIAEEYGHKSYKSVDMFMRRNGYQWNREKQIYEVRGVKPEQDPDEETGPKMVEKALELFAEGKDPREVARELGFTDHKALADYMRDKGYRWNSKTGCYELQTFEPAAEKESEAEKMVAPGSEEEMLQVLLKNKDKLAEVLHSENNGTLPRYTLSGVRIAKTIHFSNKLNKLIKQFSEENDISQREFLEMAAIEALKRYGYAAEVKGLLS